MKPTRVDSTLQPSTVAATHPAVSPAADPAAPPPQPVPFLTPLRPLMERLQRWKRIFGPRLVLLLLPDGSMKMYAPGGKTPAHSASSGDLFGGTTPSHSASSADLRGGKTPASGGDVPAPVIAGLPRVLDSAHLSRSARHHARSRVPRRPRGGGGRASARQLTVADVMREHPGYSVGSMSSKRAVLPRDKVLHPGGTYYLSKPATAAQGAQEAQNTEAQKAEGKAADGESAETAAESSASSATNWLVGAGGGKETEEEPGEADEGLLVDILGDTLREEKSPRGSLHEWKRGGLPKARPGIFKTQQSPTAENMQSPNLPFPDLHGSFGGESGGEGSTREGGAGERGKKGEKGGARGERGRLRRHESSESSKLASALQQLWRQGSGGWGVGWHAGSSPAASTLSAASPPSGTADGGWSSAASTPAGAHINPAASAAPAGGRNNPATGDGSSGPAAAHKRALSALSLQALSAEEEESGERRAGGGRRSNDGGVKEGRGGKQSMVAAAGAGVSRVWVPPGGGLRRDGEGKEEDGWAHPELGAATIHSWKLPRSHTVGSRSGVSKSAGYGADLRAQYGIVSKSGEHGADMRAQYVVSKSGGHGADMRARYLELRQKHGFPAGAEGFSNQQQQQQQWLSHLEKQQQQLQQQQLQQQQQQQQLSRLQQWHRQQQQQKQQQQTQQGKQQQQQQPQQQQQQVFHPLTHHSAWWHSMGGAGGGSQMDLHSQQQHHHHPFPPRSLSHTPSIQSHSLERTHSVPSDAFLQSALFPPSLSSQSEQPSMVTSSGSSYSAAASPGSFFFPKSPSANANGSRLSPGDVLRMVVARQEVKGKV
ncbi:unnamed protein product [Closterium sp. Naga37s-1]|nr:unnamed protein product [Closterium sp. Naga37s-1]